LGTNWNFTDVLAVWGEGYTAEELHEDVRSNPTMTSGRRLGDGGYRWMTGFRGADLGTDPEKREADFGAGEACISDI
jgi:hypothetical protein